VKRSGEKRYTKEGRERVDTDTRGALIGGKRRMEVCLMTNNPSGNA
jgi:hypothetical protein